MGLTLIESADFLYKTADYYASEYEQSIAGSDPALTIFRPLAADQPQLSVKDQAAVMVVNAQVFG